ncbi:MAG: dienelactone hydrolase family protein [Elusimicrobia bacterium]|nr:dienelactone hydrolase family protein [Candidatus Liberimonas magnetica]
MVKDFISSVFVLLVLAFALQTDVLAKIITRNIDYKSGKVPLEGFLAYDDNLKGKQPGVLIVHEWNGQGSYVQKRAVQLAELGYVAFCADIYGKGIRPKTNEESAKQAGIYRSDRKLMRERALAGLEELKKQKITDITKTAALGYCFGGGVALELARSGAEVNGVVSFHGNLDTPDPLNAKAIKGKVLVLHGANDPYVSNEQLLSFMKEMKDAGVDWELNIYANAVHRFTNSEAGDDPSTGAAYNKQADERSWDAMKSFFNEIFK